MVKIPQTTDRLIKSVFIKLVLIVAIAFFSYSQIVLAQPIYNQELTFLAGGDVEWSRMARWNLFHRDIIRYPLKFESKQEEARYPFIKIKSLLESADLTFANLESPLSDKAKRVGAFLAPTSFTEGLKWSGIDVVSVANNHALDAGVEGLKDTLNSLEQKNLPAIGGGENLDLARRPFIFKKNGVRLGFLAYTMSENSGDSSYAQPNRPGVMSTDFSLIQEDIQKLRQQVDYVILSFHWGLNNGEKPPFWVRHLAHKSIDAGADIILGHHPHYPHGIEVYNGKPIIYSLGNFIFGHNHPIWTDNFLARLTLTPKEIKKIEILPVAGENQDLAQPFLLDGERSRKLLEVVKQQTLDLKTHMNIVGEIGVINPATAQIPKTIFDDIIYDLLLPKQLWMLLAAILSLGAVIWFVISRFMRRRRRRKQKRFST